MAVDAAVPEAGRACWITLSEAALRHNVARLRACQPEAWLLAMVKANAYGHGPAAADVLAEEADGLGVATLEEGLALRVRGIRKPIQVMSGVFTAAEVTAAVAANVQPVVHCPEQVDLLVAQPLQKKGLRVWLKVNTGMNRLGLRPAEALVAYRRLVSSAVVRDVGLMTHLACADEPDRALTTQQLARFRTLQQTLASEHPAPPVDSIANSAALLSRTDVQATWVRPGIALYGASPLPGQSADALGLLPVMTVRARVLAVHTVRAGETVGYGATWQADQDTRVAVVGIGYGDGYPRHAPSGTPVLIAGRRYALIGRVSMDLITVRIDEAPVVVGDVATLWGDGLPIDDVAEAAGTLSYELLCRLTDRPQRRWMPDEQSS